MGLLNSWLLWEEWWVVQRIYRKLYWGNYKGLGKVLHWWSLYADEGSNGVGRVEIIGVDKYESAKLIIHFVSSSKQRLETKDRLAKWGMIKPSICQLCLQANVDLDHLFCQCAYAMEVWRNILEK